MKMLITLALSALMAGGVSAQSTKGQTEDAETYAARLTERMTAQLNLQPDQVEQVKAITLKCAQEGMVAGKVDKAGIQHRFEEELKKSLTPSQYEVWQRIQKDNAGKTPDGRPLKSVEPAP